MWKQLKTIQTCYQGFHKHTKKKSRIQLGKEASNEFRLQTHLQHMRHAVNHGSINRKSVHLHFLVAYEHLLTLAKSLTKNSIFSLLSRHSWECSWQSAKLWNQILPFFKSWTISNKTDQRTRTKYTPTNWLTMTRTPNIEGAKKTIWGFIPISSHAI